MFHFVTQHDKPAFAGRQARGFDYHRALCHSDEGRILRCKYRMCYDEGMYWNFGL